ncbi:MAG TPA: type II secretion system major pseudopilin GspG [Allosphingosinicella sp.]|jgi:general secretion pathway protein G
MKLSRHPGESRDLSSKRRRSGAPWGPGFRRDDGKGPPPGEAGFTLVELMVVIVIIGLLATVVVINVMPATDKAAITKAKADVGVLEQGVEMYRLNKLRYPSGSEGLQAVVAERYVKRLPKDPWGNPYVYAAPGRDGRQFDIYSFGADGREGGEGEDADIGNWDS